MLFHEKFVVEQGLSSELFEKISRFLAQGFLTGLSPIIPGTVGTIPGVLLWFFVKSDYFLLILGLAVLGLSVKGVESLILETGDSDPSRVVVDEVFGFIVAGIGHDRTAAAAVGLFLLFRIFDILKPWPASWANKREGVLFVILDDIVAGLYASGMFFLLEKFLR